MSSQDATKLTARSDRGVWVAVLRCTGICLLRLLIGLVVVALLMGIFIAVNPLSPTDHEYERLVVAALAVLILVIASVILLPLWRKQGEADVRGNARAVAATGMLLVPAILFQLFVTLRGELELGIANFLVVVSVCYLVTLARDFDRRSQFVVLLIGGAQAIVVCLVGLILGPLTPIDGWQVKAAVWLGAVPPIVLMSILYRQSREARSGSLPERYAVAKEGGGQ